MKHTKIYIPTRGRVGKQITYRYLPPSLRKSAVIVAPKAEVAALREECPDATVVAQPSKIHTISQKRAWILKSLADTTNAIMLDDDLAFFVRCSPNDRYYDLNAGFWKLTSAAKKQGIKLARVAKDPPQLSQVVKAFDQWEKLLVRYAHVGMGSRLGNHYEPLAVGFNQRHVHALGYCVDTWRKVVIPNRINLKEDFDYNLQLLRAGYLNAQIHDVFVGPGAYGAPGGCTDERALAGHDAAALRLKELHPDLVTVVEKSYKGIPRKEVIVKWRKAIGFDQKGVL